MYISCYARISLHQTFASSLSQILYFTILIICKYRQYDVIWFVITVLPRFKMYYADKPLINIHDYSLEEKSRNKLSNIEVMFIYNKYISSYIKYSLKMINNNNRFW